MLTTTPPWSLENYPFSISISIYLKKYKGITVFLLLHSTGEKAFDISCLAFFFSLIYNLIQYTIYNFNHISLSSCLTGFVQYVDCPTRGEKTLDLFYANVKEAYRAVSLPPLGRSDHSMVYLQPTYRPCVVNC